MTDVKFSSDLDVEVIDSMGNDQSVIRSARVSTGKEYHGEVPYDEARGLINFLMKNRHGTPFEHNSMTFRVKCPIFVWREFMRHRIGISYNEESGRYKQLAPEFYIPDANRNLIQSGRAGAYIFGPGTAEQYAMLRQTMREQCIQAYEAYESMLADDIAREVARMILPVNIYSSAYVTMNARSIMSFLTLRQKFGSEDAMFPSSPMKEINVVADEIELAFQENMPITHAAYVANRRVAP